MPYLFSLKLLEHLMDRYVANDADIQNYYFSVFSYIAS